MNTPSLLFLLEGGPETVDAGIEVAEKRTREAVDGIPVRVDQVG